MADLSAHLLPPRADRSARAHIDSCPECASVLRALDRTGSDLRWLPPIPMPPDVIARIDAALAAECQVVSISQLRERRRRRQQLFSVAAAGLVVLGGGGFLIAQLNGGPSGADITAGIGKDTESASPSTGPNLDEETLPGAVGDLVTGGEGDQPLTLNGTPAPDDCAPSLQLAGSDQLIGVIEIRYGGRDRDAVFFTTANPTEARVVVVEDCSVADPTTVATLRGEI